MDMTEIVVVVLMFAIYAIPIALAVWIIVAIKRLLDGIKRLSSRLDVIEQILMEKGELEKVK
jgi:hypothetical protein